MDNPSAFPNPEARDAMGAGIREGSPGMSLRDWFAGQALASIPVRRWGGDDGNMPDDIFDRWAQAAYATADAMLKARAIARDGEGV